MKWFELINQYQPCNEQEKSDKALFLHCVHTFKNVLTRQNEIAHVTSSALAVNHTRSKVLMVHHNIYQSWSWTGGHADGATDLLAVAIRELKEETGVQSVCPVFSSIFSLDVLPVLGHMKNGRYVSAHLHLSVAFLVQADDQEPLIVNRNENSGVCWVPIDEMPDYSNEPHMQELYKKLIVRAKGLPSAAMDS